MNFTKVQAVIEGTTEFNNSNITLQAGELSTFTQAIFERLQGNDIHKKRLTIELPYLQVLLDKLYLDITKDESQTTDALFSVAALNQIGKIDDVLRDFLEQQVVLISQTLRPTFPTINPEAIWNILSPFVTLEGTKEPIAEAVIQAKVIETVAKDAKTLTTTLIDALIKSKIIRPLAEEATYEIAHDALAAKIAEKRTDEEIALLEVRRLIKSQMVINKAAQELFTERQLGFIAPFLGKLILNKAEKELIDKSKKAIKKQKIRFWAIIITAFLVLGGLTIWALFQQKETKRQKEAVEQAAAKNQKLIDAFYFYDGKLALATKKTFFGEKKYGFIDKEGNPVIDYRYHKAEQFDYTGFAKVQKRIGYGWDNNIIDVLIDTLGREYKIAYSLENLDNTILALDLRGTQLTTFPLEILNYPQLQILILDGINKKNNIDPIPTSIDKLINLKHLYLQYSQIDTLTLAFNKLINLQSLSLKINKLRDISFLEKLHKIEDLDIGHNQILDISSLEKLRKIEDLDISNNQISDISPLRNLTKIKGLNISYNQIIDIRFLKNLTKLQTLNLSGNQIKNSHYLQNLAKIKDLDISRNQITNIYFLKNLTKLQTLDISYNKITDIHFLEKLTKLRTLGLNNNKITDIRFLERLTKLQTLYLSNNQITDYSFLEKLTKLQTLDLTNNQISDIRFLEKLTNLNLLDLTNNQISDIHFLEKLTNLRLLTLNNNQISDTRFLEKLTNLNLLTLSNNQISDVRFLEKLTNLKRLDLSNNQISDISSLEKLTNLESLSLGRNKITEENKQWLKEKLPNCEIEFW